MRLEVRGAAASVTTSAPMLMVSLIVSLMVVPSAVPTVARGAPSTPPPRALLLVGVEQLRSTALTQPDERRVDVVVRLLERTETNAGDKMPVRI